MIDIHAWMPGFLQALDDSFGDRVWFVGLQGSYGRGEATDQSDLDLVVILDELSAGDIRLYHDMLERLPNRELICGFLSGKREIIHWERSDLFQFCHDTLPIRGSMTELLDLIEISDVQRAVKIAACNVYHGCVHNMIYDKSDDILKGLYKAASFAVQAICYLQTGSYVVRQKDLLEVVSEQERKIVETFMELKGGGTVEFDPMSERLLDWASQWIS